MTRDRRWQQPKECPTCSGELRVRGLGCDTCGTEVRGAFEPCALCTLPANERELIETFLISRGRVKTLQEHLGVSYPTARGRLEAALDAMGIEAARPADPYRRALAELAAGKIDVEEAQLRLRGVRAGL